ncbi:MAG: InlB B-repeat-containing protein [Clostridiales bacterium]|nr:InlB B-repeat-containing protein [Clostridiales bacterium]
MDDADCGQKITFVPPIPEREGYTFDGWYKEEECLNFWNFESDVLPNAIYDDNGEVVYQETRLHAKRSIK